VFDACLIGGLLFSRGWHAGAMLSARRISCLSARSVQKHPVLATSNSDV